MVMEIFSPLIEIGKMIYTPISKCVKYHRGLDESMQILKEKLEYLNARKTDIESQIRAEHRSNKVSKEEVKLWFEKVQKINDDKEELEKEVAKGKFISRSRLGRRAAAKIQEVEALHQEGSFSNGLMIDAIPSRGEMIPTTATLAGKATSKKVEEIWNSLINSDVLKIGVWGMGGSGKTTIMKLIRNRVFEKTDRFDNVYWITVSKETSVFKLQEGIASALKVKDFEEIKEEVDRAAKLSAKFKEGKRYVLIFDDVWEAFNLEDIGIPEPTIGNGCKLILTTRSLEVCRRMDCMPSKMELLSEDEAWNLFLEKVGRDVIMTSGLEKIAKQVAKECACLPLAIIAVGTSMKGVAGKHRWRTALKELRECTKGFKEMSKVIEQLKYSYTRLNDEQAQRSLLYCALYPEDYEIQRDELIACLIDEEVIEEVESRKDAFDKGHTILDELENACLLESSRNILGPCVKMHDVIRDMALQIRGRESMVECGVQVVEFPKEERWNDNLETVSLMGTNIKEIHVDASPRCSKLKTLRLSRSNLLSSIPNSFFLHMPSLCVLDLSHTKIEILPNSISELENLTALVLRESGVRCVPSLAKLQKLRVLDLCDTKKMERIPEGMEMLVNLQYLNLRRSGAKTFPIGILPKLIRLQFFSARGTSLKIKGEELMGLKELETLECNLSVNDFNSYRNLPSRYFVHVGVLGRRRGVIFPEDDDESKNFKRLHVSLFKEEEEEGERSIVVLPNNVEQVDIDDSDVEQVDIDDSDVEQVDIDDSDGVGVESSRLPFVEGELWFNVEELTFDRLSKLRVLVDDIDRSQLQLMSHGSNGTTFSCLRRLSLYSCHKLKHLFKLELVPYFPNLEWISVGECDEMEELVGVEEEEEESDDLSIVNDALTITFPKLRSLWLCNLPELKSIICKKEIMMVCDSIEEIHIDGCPKLKRLPLYLPLLQHNGQPSPPAALKVIRVHNEERRNSLEWDNPITKDVLQPFVKLEVLLFIELRKLRVLVDRSQLQLMSHGSNGTTFSCLRQLDVFDCNKLKHLFKLELVPYFPNLESIYVGDCSEMEELVGVEEEEERDDLSIVNDALTITFPKLRSLWLCNLPELKSIICKKEIMMVCDSIETIQILFCPKLKRLPLYLPLLQHNGQPSPPAALKVIEARPQEWWDSLEWDNPIAKDVLQPFVKLRK